MKKWGPVFVWAGLIFFLSSRSVPPPTGVFFFDVVFPYLAHLVEFGVFFVLLWRVNRKTTLSALIAVLYALSDEYHQSFVPTRTPSISDVVVDVLGIMMAWWIILWLPKAPPRLKAWAKKLAVI